MNREDKTSDRYQRFGKFLVAEMQRDSTFPRFGPRRWQPAAAEIYLARKLEAFDREHNQERVDE